jgi:two-component system, OmpR family, sensor kinase
MSAQAWCRTASIEPAEVAQPVQQRPTHPGPDALRLPSVQPSTAGHTPITRLASWCRRVWMALGLRGRLVAGYSALFAVLLLGIAVGETTVVRQVLIESRAAALPAALNDLGALLHEPPGGRGAGDQAVAIGGAVLNVEGPLPAVTGNRQLVLALIASDGSVLSRVAGDEVGDVDPRRLLVSRRAAGDPAQGATSAPATYQRTVGATTYLVHARTAWMAVQPAPGTGAPLLVGPLAAPPPLLQTGPGGVVSPGAPALSGGGPEPLEPVTMLAAESLRTVDETVRALLVITLAASAIGLVLAAAAGLAVARQALRPLEHMTATAQAIAAGGSAALDQRLRLPAQGDEVGRLASTFDRMLDRIQATIAERERSESRLRRFAADASHELRTPLAAVSGYTEALLLGGKDDPETTAHVLQQMHGELGRMNRLVGDLLMLARLEARLPLHVQALPVAPLLEGLVQETRLLAARAGHDVTVADSGTTGAGSLAVLADPDRLHQILLNLLDNAVKFTPDGGRVTVGAARRNGSVALSVADTGPGIPAEELPLLFERFYRGDKARTRGGRGGDGGDGGGGGDSGDGGGVTSGSSGGAGLGLAIAQGLAQAHGGEIEVASTVGAGTTFTVLLPAAPDEIDAADSPTS